MIVCEMLATCSRKRTFYLAMQVIDAVVPRSAEDFVKKEFLHKLGSTNYARQPGISGLPAGGWKSSKTSRAMLKIWPPSIKRWPMQGRAARLQPVHHEAASRVLHVSDDDIFGAPQTCPIRAMAISGGAPIRPMAIKATSATLLRVVAASLSLTSRSYIRYLWLQGVLILLKSKTLSVPFRWCSVGIACLC